MPDHPTHIAYSDESYSTASRYRSVAAVTLEAARDAEITLTFQALLQQSGLSEFKWARLRQARERFAAVAIIDETMKLTTAGWLRVDVLIWDTYDSRHRVQGRDDVANLQRMYYHLFKNVLLNRWPTGSTWKLCPDENSALDWMTAQDFLDAAGLGIRAQPNFLDQGGFRLRLERDYGIQQICEMCSSDAPLCQLADLFAGLGVYSHSAYPKYASWLRKRSGQLTLDFGLDNHDIRLSNSDRDRCKVMHHLNGHCKRRKLRVGLESSRGFKTHDPRFPINFWLYEPQHPDDRAPVTGNQS